MFSPNSTIYLQWDDEDVFHHIRTSFKGAEGHVLWDIGRCATTADIVSSRQGLESSFMLNVSRQSCMLGGGLLQQLYETSVVW